jgi:hypothetical protein
LLVRFWETFLDSRPDKLYVNVAPKNVRVTFQTHFQSTSQVTLQPTSKQLCSNLTNNIEGNICHPVANIKKYCCTTPWAGFPLKAGKKAFKLSSLLSAFRIARVLRDSSKLPKVVVTYHFKCDVNSIIRLCYRLAVEKYGAHWVEPNLIESLLFHL